MVFLMKQMSILILLLQVLHSLCTIQFVLLVDDSERDYSLIESVGVAVDRINNDDTQLADQNLYYSTVQSKGSPQVAIEELAQDLNNTFCIIDAAHPTVSEAVASISFYTSLLMITMTTTATSYDTVYSTVPSYDLVPQALVQVMDYNKWTEATIISELTKGFMERHTSIGNAFTTANINFESSVRFDLSEDLSSYIKAIFDAEPHIYILNTDERATLWFLCEAYKDQRYYPNYAWITFNSFPNQWWEEYDEYLQQINCTQPDIVVNTVLNRALVLLPYPEIFTLNGSKDSIFNISNYIADAVTVFSVAMDSCLDSCQEYSQRDNCLVYCKQQLIDFTGSINITGITGNIQFNENGIRISNSVNIYQYQEQGDELTIELIGKIHNNTYIAANVSSVWPDGVPPDGTPIKIVNILELWVPILGGFLQSISVSFLIVCLSFNIIFRKRKIVKLTSPNLNYIMILGAVGLVSSGVVYRFTSVTSQIILCTMDRLSATWGYDICFAVALVKTMRVFYIFKMTYPKKRALQDWKLILIIAGIVIANIILSLPIIIVALFNDDIKLKSDPNTKSDKNEQGVEQNYYIIVCGTSIYFTLFLVVTVLFKIVLHIIGLVLAFLTRNVEVDALNDAKYSATIIYFSTVMLILIVIINPTVANNPNLDDAVWTILCFMMIFMFLGLTFIPKMIALYRDPHGKYTFKQFTIGASQLKKSGDSQGDTGVTRLSKGDSFTTCIKNQLPNDCSKSDF